MTENKIARPIEFRAWDENKNEWLPMKTLELLAIYNLHDSNLTGYQRGSKLIFEQFTGLTDCDGVKIFEGDIVEFARYWIGGIPKPAGTGEVVFDDGAFQIGFGDDYGFELTQNDINDKLLRVIGNIHEQATASGN